MGPTDYWPRTLINRDFSTHDPPCSLWAWAEPWEPCLLGSVLTVPDSMPAADKRSQASKVLPAPDVDAGRGGQRQSQTGR